MTFHGLRQQVLVAEVDQVDAFLGHGAVCEDSLDLIELGSNRARVSLGEIDAGRAQGSFEVVVIAETRQCGFDFLSFGDGLALCIRDHVDRVGAHGGDGRPSPGEVTG